jgi:aryl carrier-like protein
METHKKVTDVVTGRTYYERITEETPEQILWSRMPYIGRELFPLMMEQLPEVVVEKMKDPEAFLEEIEKLAMEHLDEGMKLIQSGMDHIEAMAVSRRSAAAKLGL